MPLSINVGLSRKASRDYQSTGVSINVTAELDSALLARPEQLQQQVADLYAQAEMAMDRQSAKIASPVAGPARSNGRSASGGTNGHRQINGNGRHNGGDMTASQRRAILAIADRAHLDAAQEAHDLFRVALDDLTIRQASELIDHLKGLQTSGNGHSGDHR